MPVERFFKHFVEEEGARVSFLSPVRKIKDGTKPKRTLGVAFKLEKKQYAEVPLTIRWLGNHLYRGVSVHSPDRELPFTISRQLGQGQAGGLHTSDFDLSYQRELPTQTLFLEVTVAEEKAELLRRAHNYLLGQR